MAYQRFLTNKDYEAVLSPEQWNMLVRDMPGRISQAEQSAEMNFLEYLDQYYEIEKLLRVGKAIKEYNAGVSYPANVWFIKDEVIYKTMTAISGYKKPTTQIYWEQLTEVWAIPDADRKPKYSQLHTYAVGDIVRFGTEWYVCKIAHGYDFNNIVLPEVSAWVRVEATPWEPNMDWNKNDVCSFNSAFYTYMVDNSQPSEDDESETETPELSDGPVLTPEEDDAWALIGDYSLDYTYDASEGAFDYVVCDGVVFMPKVNPNADEIVEGVNVTIDDPRHPNVVTHMVRIATYYLHQLISPTNISETRRWAYEDSMQWLVNASKFKINPRLPRKKECETGEDKVDWALETFMREFNPSENPWLI